MSAGELQRQLRRLLEKGPTRFEPLPPSPVRPAIPGGVSRGDPAGGQQITLVEEDRTVAPVYRTLRPEKVYEFEAMQRARTHRGEP